MIFHDRDIILFINDSAALSSLVKVSSLQGDMTQLAMLTLVSLAFLETQTFIEWVRSNANLSDAPSKGQDIAQMQGIEQQPVRLDMPRRLSPEPSMRPTAC